MKIGAKHIQIIAALILLGIGIVLSLHLMVSYSVPLPLFIVMLIMFVFVAMVVFFQDRISGFSWSSLKVEVAAVQKARIEVEAKREEVERLAYLTVRLVAASQEAQATWGMNEKVEAEFRAVATEILTTAGIDPSDEIFSKIDNINRS